MTGAQWKMTTAKFQIGEFGRQSREMGVNFGPPLPPPGTSADDGLKIMLEQLQDVIAGHCEPFPSNLGVMVDNKKRRRVNIVYGRAPRSTGADAQSG
jgi:hypothetical protein